MSREFSVAEAIALQRDGCADGGSDLYARLLDGLAADHAGGGLTAELLDERTERPVHDALALRLLGTVHRIVLEGRAPALARYYPSVGGDDEGDPTPAFLATVARHRVEVERRLSRGVQTNEVGRAAVLAPGFALVARRTRLPLRLLEVGSSAGLLLRWDQYRYVTAGGELGDATSSLVFDDAWVEPVPDLAGPVSIAERRGCDLAPIDAGTPDGRLTLLSFVWPDQQDRFARLRAALDIAAAHPVDIDRADAAGWVTAQLARAATGLATVIFHSIVLQYLTPAGRRRMRDAISHAGLSATPSAPLAWLRMEPAGPRAELRVTSWPGGREELLASCGYHGQEIRWSAGDDSRSGLPPRTTARASPPPG